MIYIHQQAIDNITNDKSDLKSKIYQYRHAILSGFCATYDLPMPEYAKHAHGKPFVTNSSLAFNQSHCQTDYALAWSLGVANVGVDIENVGRQANLQGLARRYFHVDEYRYWQDGGFERALWFVIWTAKEAVLKAHGLGIRLNLNELNAQFISKNHGKIHHHAIGEFYFESIKQDKCVLTLAYPCANGRQPWCWYK